MSLLKRPKRTKSQKQERGLAERFGGRTTPRSGAGRIKGDVVTTEEMIEAKTTSKTQYTVKLLDLQKLEREALADRRRPVFVIRLNDDATAHLFNKEWVLIPARDYQALTHDQREEP